MACATQMICFLIHKTHPVIGITRTFQEFDLKLVNDPKTILKGKHWLNPTHDFERHLIQVK